MGASWKISRPDPSSWHDKSSGLEEACDCEVRGLQDPGPVVRSFVLENDPALIDGVIDQLMAVATDLQFFAEGVAQRVSLALHEAMLNGMHHGNLELDSTLRKGDETAYHRLANQRRKMEHYRHRRLHVRAIFNPSEAVFIIGDEGPGYNPSGLPDPSDPTTFEYPCGRGLVLIRAFMDEVTFNSTGNEITLVKRRRSAPPH